MSIATNVANVRDRIEAAARRADRDPSSVRLVAVTKGMTPAAIREAMACGVADFGENFVQEAAEHREALSDSNTAWHFIGHLQTNKTSLALNLFDIIQSVDSLRLAEQLSRRTEKALRILLEVNVAAETSKFGFAPGEVAEAVGRIARLPNLTLLGLMTIAPAIADAEAVRPVFRELRDLARANRLDELSMGMTDDFEVAVEEGSTMVRVGRAIFGKRPA